MDEISLSIDNIDIKVPRGTTILEAARISGIYIPSICSHPDLKPVGMCKLCVVDIKGWDRFPTACDTLAEQGMIVSTKTEELQEMRRNALEILLSLTNHPVSYFSCDRKLECSDFRECMRRFPSTVCCSYCPKNGECEIQKAATYVGLEKVRYQTTYRNLPVLREPFFDRDYNLCILCGRCARMCAEVRGEGILASNPDYHRRHSIGPESLVDSGCKFCGACVDACPTGALYARFERWQRPKDTITTTCPYCGVGCQMDLGVLDNRIVRVRGKRAAPNSGQLCVKGRFGLDFIDNPERLKTPLIRRNGSLAPATWEEAFSLIAERLSRYQGDSFAMLSSAKCTNEENYIAQKFARLVMGTNNIDHCARLCHASTISALAQSFGSGAMTNSIAELNDSGCIFVIGSNTSEQHPVIALKIRDAKLRGAKIIVANPRWIDLCKIADVWLRLQPGTDVPLILDICKAILDEGLIDADFIGRRCEQFEEFRDHLIKTEYSSGVTGVDHDLIKQAARMYAAGKPSSIIYSMGITQHSHGVDNVLALANLAMMTGNVGIPSSGINPLRGQNNVQGSSDMGALPNLLPGYQSVSQEVVKEKFKEIWGSKMPDSPGLTLIEMMNAAGAGKIKAMYIIGENPILSEPDSNHVREALKQLEFLVVQDIFLTETAELADIVLPAVSFAEKDGTFTNTERRVQRIRKAIAPVGKSMADWEILTELGRRMGHEKEFAYSGPADIMSEISKVAPIYKGINYERLEESGIQWPCPSTDHPGTKFLHQGSFTRGKGKFHIVSYRPPSEMPDKEYPFVLTTGRILTQYHTGTMTRKVNDLNYLRGEELVEINPEDGMSLGIMGGDLIDVSSRRGTVRARAKLTDNSPKGVVFMTFHFAESPTNVLTNPAFDPIAKIPELKVCTVKLEKVAESGES